MAFRTRHWAILARRMIAPINAQSAAPAANRLESRSREALLNTNCKDKPAPKNKSGIRNWLGWWFRSFPEVREQFAPQRPQKGYAKQQLTDRKRHRNGNPVR